MSSGERELQELEARLREAEQRLARVSRHNSPSRGAGSGGEDKHTADDVARIHPLAQRPSYPDDRPPTSDELPGTPRSNKQPMMTGMPAASQHLSGSTEYVMVDRTQRGYG